MFVERKALFLHQGRIATPFLKRFRCEEECAYSRDHVTEMKRISLSVKAEIKCSDFVYARDCLQGKITNSFSMGSQYCEDRKKSTPILSTDDE